MLKRSSSLYVLLAIAAVDRLKLRASSCVLRAVFCLLVCPRCASCDGRTRETQGAAFELPSPAAVIGARTTRDRSASSGAHVSLCLSQCLPSCLRCGARARTILRHNPSNAQMTPYGAHRGSSEDAPRGQFNHTSHAVESTPAPCPASASPPPAQHVRRVICLTLIGGGTSSNGRLNAMAGYRNLATLVDG